VPFLHQGSHLSHGLEIGLMSLAGFAAIAAILYARHRYVTLHHLTSDEAKLTGFEKLVYHKFYVDELYEKLISQPFFRLSEFFGGWVDKLIIDRVVNGTAWWIDATGRTMRLFQNGNTGFYVFAMVAGMIILFIIRLLL